MWSIPAISSRSYRRPRCHTRCQEGPEWSITVPLASNRTVTTGPGLVLEGTIETDTGPLEWTAERSLDGAVTVNGAVPRITMTIEGTETFTEVGSGALFTTCVVRFAESAVRTSQ